MHCYNKMKHFIIICINKVVGALCILSVFSYTAWYIFVNDCIVFEAATLNMINEMLKQDNTLHPWALCWILKDFSIYRFWYPRGPGTNPLEILRDNCISASLHPPLKFVHKSWLGIPDLFRRNYCVNRRLYVHRNL